MKYKIILLFLLSSCINSNHVGNDNFSYSAKGFAKIDTQSSLAKKDIYFAHHNKLKLGTKISLTNPANGKSLETVIKKKIKYNNFYKVLISKSIVVELDLDSNFPYIEIIEKKTNKSFIAKKAITETVEKKIANKAPITKINIDNLTKSKNTTKTKVKNYSILVAEFYSLESAQILKKKVVSMLENSNYKLIYIKKKKKNLTNYYWDHIIL
jgi:hypothetical protein